MVSQGVSLQDVCARFMCCMCVLQGSATLSMAYAGALFADACLRGLNGENNVFEYTYVESDVTEVPYFASKVELGPEGKSLQQA